jgi:hypothetical protein
MSDSRFLSVPLWQGGQPPANLLPPHHISPVTAVDVAFLKRLLIVTGWW